MIEDQDSSVRDALMLTTAERVRRVRAQVRAVSGAITSARKEQHSLREELGVLTTPALRKLVEQEAEELSAVLEVTPGVTACTEEAAVAAAPFGQSIEAAKEGIRTTTVRSTAPRGFCVCDPSSPVYPRSLGLRPCVRSATCCSGKCRAWRTR